MQHKNLFYFKRTSQDMREINQDFDIHMIRKFKRSLPLHKKKKYYIKWNPVFEDVNNQ